MWGSGDSPSPGAEAGVGRGRDGTGGLWGGIHQGKSRLKEGVLRGSGLIFSYPTILFLQQQLNLKKIALNPCHPWRPK